MFNLRVKTHSTCTEMPAKKLGDRALLTLVRKLYLDEKNIKTAFSTPYIIYKHLKNENYKVTLSRITKALEHIETYQLHKQAKAKFTRQPILSKGIDYCHEADLMDVSTLQKFNDKKKFILIVICQFSKRVSFEALKNKTNSEVVKGFDKIYRRRKKPVKLFTDFGKEFVGAHSKAYFAKHGIIYYNSYSVFKAAISERAIRSAKNLMYRYFTSKKTKRYLEFLPQLEKIMNSRYHRSIKMAPNDVQKSNEKQVYNNLYSAYFKRRAKRAPFPIGTLVRLSKWKHAFSKSYLPSWTSEQFQISSVKKTPGGHFYFLKDASGDDILGKFYRSDLSVVRK